MKIMLFPPYQFISRLFTGVSVATVLLTSAPSLRAQTNFDFNASTDPGWQQWLPEFYGAADTNGGFTNGVNLPTITFTTNDVSAGNLAYSFHVGTSNSSQFIPPTVGSFITNGTPLGDFTMTGEFFHWTNGQGQEFGLAGRVQLPVPSVNPPNEESNTNSYPPTCIALVYANARSAKNYNSSHPSGSTDNLRINFVYIDPVTQGPNISVIASASLSGPGANYTAGQSLSPDSTNGHYRLIMTASSATNGGFSGQLVDLSTGLPMQMGFNQNIITTRAYYSNFFKSAPYAGTNVQYYLTNNGTIISNGVIISATLPLGSAYGFIASLGSSGVSAYVPGNNTVGQPIDPKFDNFAIVPGVVTLESAAAVTGPYATDTSAGIEVYPRRITVPLNGDTRFYRINWIGCDHAPTITSIAAGPTVNVVTASGPTTTVTNAVKTMVLGYN